MFSLQSFSQSVFRIYFDLYYKSWNDRDNDIWLSCVRSKTSLFGQRIFEEQYFRHQDFRAISLYLLSIVPSLERLWRWNQILCNLPFSVIRLNTFTKKINSKRACENNRSMRWRWFRYRGNTNSPRPCLKLTNRVRCGKNDINLKLSCFLDLFIVSLRGYCFVNTNIRQYRALTGKTLFVVPTRQKRIAIYSRQF